LQSAYNLPSGLGGGQLVAIVDAGDDPNAEADLAVYRQTYGLPACTTANGCFEKVNQLGQQGNYPPKILTGNWPFEESLDLDMVSAACPDCHILLVEANTNSISDLAAAAGTSASFGPVAISNSYGTSEFAGMDAYASFYDHPGMAITVASGDSGYGPAQFPAVLSTVIAVGGTSLLHRASGSRGWTEDAWSGSGSGCSALVPKPAWQHDKLCSMRTTADVSAVADPNTGVAVYDTVPLFGLEGWLVAGGTSASAPFIAGVIGLAGNGGIPPSYPYAETHAHALYDMTSGSNGFCGGTYLCTAKRGYDGPTGLGTPDGAAAF
jgi:subtilase family serine protease